MTIGERIKTLRHKNDLTQERLAEFLSVSPQAVSKWECGLACPDLGLILPLTKILHVTADALLGLEPETRDEEYVRFETAWQYYRDHWVQPGDYVLARAAVMAYPDDCRFTEWLASTEYQLAFMENQSGKCGSTVFLEEMTENALRRYDAVIENSDNYELVCKAAAGKVITLRFCERLEEAEWSAESEYPDPYIHTTEQILAMHPAGKELTAILAEETAQSIL